MLERVAPFGRLPNGAEFIVRRGQSGGYMTRLCLQSPFWATRQQPDVGLSSWLYTVHSEHIPSCHTSRSLGVGERDALVAEVLASADERNDSSGITGESKSTMTAPPLFSFSIPPWKIENRSRKPRSNSRFSVSIIINPSVQFLQKKASFCYNQPAIRLICDERSRKP